MSGGTGFNIYPDKSAHAASASGLEGSGNVTIYGMNVPPWPNYDDAVTDAVTDVARDVGISPTLLVLAAGGAAIIYANRKRIFK